jgi:hypothetical protein
MKPLTMEELRELRADMAHLNLSDDKLDDLIRLVDSIIISIIDQNSGRHSIQLSLAARANHAFKKRRISDDFSGSDSDPVVDFGDDFAILSSHQQISFEPD